MPEVGRKADDSLPGACCSAETSGRQTVRQGHSLQAFYGFSIPMGGIWRVYFEPATTRLPGPHPAARPGLA